MLKKQINTALYVCNYSLKIVPAYVLMSSNVPHSSSFICFSLYFIFIFSACSKPETKLLKLVGSKYSEENIILCVHVHMLMHRVCSSPS